jgi:hypothetical protein
MGLPCVVDLEMNGVDGWGGPSLLALAICEVERPAELDEGGTWYLCLGSDNRCPQHVCLSPISQ